MRGHLNLASSARGKTQTENREGDELVSKPLLSDIAVIISLRSTFFFFFFKVVQHFSLIATMSKAISEESYRTVTNYRICSVVMVTLYLTVLSSNAITIKTWHQELLCCQLHFHFLCLFFLCLIKKTLQYVNSTPMVNKVH